MTTHLLLKLPRGVLWRVSNQVPRNIFSAVRMIDTVQSNICNDLKIILLLEQQCTRHSPLEGYTAKRKFQSELNPTGNMAGSPLTTHVLDTSKGQPARALPIELYRSTCDNSWTIISKGETNNDGRCPGLLTQETFTRGVYKIKFDTGDYFRKTNTQGFYPYVEIVFEIVDPSQHYHVPLLLSPYSYSTYRGS